ncbi:uncharacterized protein LOC131251951 [Magnolia sinica]|uniref:uncharacterized protein LOC131251951 n=1 Tax=Magnolia sinica TaxID=86752 RepID=UPI00265A06D5|nr:uncharacterized protein LOC131251951 [Magnolia sinica]
MKSNQDTIDFEFGTSQRFEEQLHRQKQHQKRDQHQVKDVPTMAYADELFRNGKVLPLKPPPRLQFVNSSSASISSTISSTKLSGMAQCVPFSGRNFKPNEFDPFKVALEYVTKEEIEKDPQTTYRRTQSHTTSRTYYLDDELTRGVHCQNKEVGPLSCTKGPTRPERSASARSVLPTRLDPVPRLATDIDGPSAKVTKRWRSFPEGSKRERIKNFLFRSASQGRVQSKDKLRDHTDPLRKKEDAKSPVLEPFHETKCKEKMAKEKKKTAAPYKPGLFVCMGYNSKEEFGSPS